MHRALLPEIGRIERGQRQSKASHDQCLNRLGFVLEPGAVRAGARVSMCQPVRQLVHECQQLLLWTQAQAQRNHVAAKLATHALGQSRAHQASAASFNISLERADVVDEDRCHCPVSF